MRPTTPTHSPTVSHQLGKDRKGGKQPETEERKQPVGLAQRQRRESSLGDWPRDRESSLWNWPRDSVEKAACGTGPETKERKQPVGLAQRQRRESSMWNWPRDRGKKAACGTGPEKAACGTGPETEERKQPVASQKRGSSRCANLVIIFQLVRFASSSESEV